MSEKATEDHILSKENLQLSKALRDLSDIEEKLEKIDEKVNEYRINITEPVYDERYEVISRIPNFWKTVLQEHSDFADFIPVSDFKFIDLIRNIKLTMLNTTDYSLKFEFADSEGFPEQTIVKTFTICKDITKLKYTSKLTDEELLDMSEFGFLTSEPVDITWPEEYDAINPIKLSTNTKDADFKKNYRQGMKTFFAWFGWTGLKHGKEFPNGDGLANLFMEDIYPHCLKHYIEAKRDIEDERGASDSEVEDDEEDIDRFNMSVMENDDEEPATKKVKK
ncbi:hypothetical protein DAHU10_013680 [Hanseniaspora uvarum]|nr:hypothetical protein DAHU10_013680 [Hanseniaspora uvarum]